MARFYEIQFDFCRAWGGVATECQGGALAITLFDIEVTTEDEGIGKFTRRSRSPT